MIDFLITIPFSAYEGINQVPCHIEATNLPSGITLGENTDSTDSTNGQIILNVAKGNDLGGDINGNAVLTCTVTGINGTQEITKKFSWFKALQGSDGKDAEFYTLESSVNSLKKCTIETASIPFHALTVSYLLVMHSSVLFRIYTIYFKPIPYN